MLIKRIHLGPGYILNNEHFYTRISWMDTKPEYLSAKNREWFEKVKDKLEEGDYIKASPDFLMGMLKAASTTIGLIPIFGIRDAINFSKEPEIK